MIVEVVATLALLLRPLPLRVDAPISGLISTAASDMAGAAKPKLASVCCASSQEGDVDSWGVRYL